MDFTSFLFFLLPYLKSRVPLWQLYYLLVLIFLPLTSGNPFKKASQFLQSIFFFTSRCTGPKDSNTICRGFQHSCYLAIVINFSGGTLSHSFHLIYFLHNILTTTDTYSYSCLDYWFMKRNSQKSNPQSIK